MISTTLRSAPGPRVPVHGILALLRWQSCLSGGMGGHGGLNILPQKRWNGEPALLPDLGARPSKAAIC